VLKVTLVMWKPLIQLRMSTVFVLPGCSTGQSMPCGMPPL
jgi:hypothetical protein